MARVSDHHYMFRPRIAATTQLQRSSNRSIVCRPLSSAAEYLWHPATDEIFLDDGPEERNARLLEFLEDQLQSWIQHPSNSTWSGPQAASDE